MTDVTDRAAEPVTLDKGDRGDKPDTADRDVRFVAVRVNLLPDEIVAGRRTEVLRRRVLIGLGALVALLIVFYGFSWWQTHSANSDLEAARSSQAALQRESQQYAPIVAAKNTTSTIQNQLRSLMAGDVSWNDMLTTLRRAAPAGTTITQIDGTVDAGAAGAGGTGATPDVLNQTGLAQIGSITLTGNAKDKRAVADLADSLSKVKGLGPAFVSNVTSAEGRTTWTITVPLTTDALGGRYQAKPTNGGK